MRFWKRIVHWRKRRRFEQDLAEEIRIHREMAEEWEPGHSREFGSVAAALEESRAVWRFAWLESLGQDIRYALRTFRKSPGFALAVVGTIGAALGLNTTLFTVVNAYALRPVAAADPDSLYQMQLTWTGKAPHVHFTAAELQSLRELRSPFRDALAYRNFLGAVDGRGMLGQAVSDNYFSLLGAGIFQGRPFLPGDRAVMVLSHATWRNRFGSDPGMVGRKVHVRGQPFEVVGIAAQDFAGLESVPAGSGFR